MKQETKMGILLGTAFDLIMDPYIWVAFFKGAVLGLIIGYFIF
jgi:hypothetical protein